VQVQVQVQVLEAASPLDWVVNSREASRAPALYQAEWSWTVAASQRPPVVSSKARLLMVCWWMIQSCRRWCYRRRHIP